MPARHLDSESLTRRLKNRQVSQAAVKGAYELILQFSDGTILHVEASSQLLTRVEDAITPEASDASERPTKRQLEYLAFIAKYMDRFGRAPAEADIQRHFLVSAPSVNQMMQMLERRGFITRLPGVPRSAATSKETEIKLTSVARASLEELLIDYRDFLRTRGLEEWPAEHALRSPAPQAEPDPGCDL
ncbi:MAG TPA: hypothetical protein VF173_31465 [Thermoanaerobaculia bacterium]|nr:hypothetical protein [Thermoanaerobaculia bacterium]